MSTFHQRRPHAPALLALCALAACAAQAQTLAQTPPQSLGLVEPVDASQTLELRVGQRFEYDSNVFRLSSSADTAALLGTSSRSDLYGVTTLGMKFDKRYSLQRLELDIYAQNYRYRDFSALDFTSLNYAAAWRWSLTPRLHGNLTADRREMLDNTVDFYSPTEVNRRVEQAAVLDAEYEIGAALRLLGGVYERRLDNSLAQTYEADATVKGGEVGMRHVWASGNSVAYKFKSGTGEYSGRLPAPQAPNDFSDREHEFSVNLSPEPGTSVQARLAHLKRSHDGFEVRDFSGFRGQLSGSWPLTGKTRLDAGVVRELGSYQTTTASYYEGERLYISPVWKPTEKTAVRLRLDQGVRRYKGELAGVPPIGRRDTSTLTSLSLEWEVIRPLKVAVTLQQDKRTSNAGFDYKANVLGVSALFSF
jgi:exopolysaccharide biosynthesis operon protein EpsL